MNTLVGSAGPKQYSLFTIPLPVRDWWMSDSNQTEGRTEFFFPLRLLSFLPSLFLLLYSVSRESVFMKIHDVYRQMLFVRVIGFKFKF